MAIHHDVFVLDTLNSPLGAIFVATDEQERLRVLDFATHEERMRRLVRLQYRGAASLRPGRISRAIRSALRAYFDGDLAALGAVEVATGGTSFQREVWRALRDIPPGGTRSYGELAAAIGRPRAVRAVGLAIGANPAGIVVPCHRVIGANASLTGYAGGLERKRWLLSHEGALPRRQGPSRDVIDAEARAP
jgi:methylated-DNA-[protein]-cysteine S-methyltransferase